MKLSIKQQQVQELITIFIYAGIGLLTPLIFFILPESLLNQIHQLVIILSTLIISFLVGYLGVRRINKNAYWALADSNLIYGFYIALAMLILAMIAGYLIDGNLTFGYGILSAIMMAFGGAMVKEQHASDETKEKDCKENKSLYLKLKIVTLYGFLEFLGTAMLISTISNNLGIYIPGLVGPFVLIFSVIIGYKITEKFNQYDAKNTVLTQIFRGALAGLAAKLIDAVISLLLDGNLGSWEGTPMALVTGFGGLLFYISYKRKSRK